MKRHIAKVMGLGALFGLGACATGPDFTVPLVDISAPSVAAGGSVAITSEIANIGNEVAPVPNAPGSDVSTTVNLRLYNDPGDIASVAFLTGWGPTWALAPGTVERFTNSTTVIPGGTPAGDYLVCGDVDPGDLTAELDETNNRTCAPLRVTSGAGAKPDLMFEFVRPLHVEGASYKLDGVVRNVGSATAPIFRIDGYQRSPERWPVLVTSCFLTPAQRAAGGAAPCPAIFSPRPLAPGESFAWKMWVTLPMDRPAGTVEIIDFMVDGCFPRLEPGLPSWCRVDEANEANNEVSAPVVVP